MPTAQGEEEVNGLVDARGKPLKTKQTEHRPIIWLASYPKSGNTWVRHFLACYIADQPVAINSLQLFQMWAMDTTLQPFQEVLKLPSLSIRSQDIPPARAAVHAHIASKVPPGQTVFCKTHNALVLDHGHPCINLDVTKAAVYVIRDPRDIVVSAAHHFKMPVDRAILGLGRQDARIGGLQALNLISSWSTHVQSWGRATATGRFPLLWVRYEDLHTVPEKAFGDVVKFAGLKFDALRLKRAINAATFEHVKADEMEHGFVEAVDKATPFYRDGKVGGWRDVLTVQQAARIEATHGKVMRAFGYLLTVDTPPRPELTSQQEKVAELVGEA